MSYYSPSPYGHGHGYAPTGHYPPMPYMSGSQGYPVYDSTYPMPMSMPMGGGYDSGYYPGNSYYGGYSHYDGHRSHRRHRHHSSRSPRVYVKHRTMGDHFMSMMGMPQAHLTRL